MEKLDSTGPGALSAIRLEAICNLLCEQIYVINNRVSQRPLSEVEQLEIPLVASSLTFLISVSSKENKKSNEHSLTFKQLQIREAKTPSVISKSFSDLAHEIVKIQKQFKGALLQDLAICLYQVISTETFDLCDAKALDKFLPGVHGIEINFHSKISHLLPRAFLGDSSLQFVLVKAFKSLALPGAEAIDISCPEHVILPPEPLTHASLRLVSYRTSQVPYLNFCIKNGPRLSQIYNLNITSPPEKAKKAKKALLLSTPSSSSPSSSSSSSSSSQRRKQTPKKQATPRPQEEEEEEAEEEKWNDEEEEQEEEEVEKEYRKKKKPSKEMEDDPFRSDDSSSDPGNESEEIENEILKFKAKNEKRREMSSASGSTTGIAVFLFVALIAAFYFAYQSENYNVRYEDFLNNYRILGATMETDINEINRKFRRLSIEKHPDKCKECNPEEYLRIVEAHKQINDFHKGILTFSDSVVVST